MRTYNLVFNGNACLGNVNDIISGGSPFESTYCFQVDIAGDFNSPPLPDGTGNESWPKFWLVELHRPLLSPRTTGISTSPIPGFFESIGSLCYQCSHLNTDVYFFHKRYQPANGWHCGLYSVCFTRDGSETSGRWRRYGGWKRRTKTIQPGLSRKPKWR